MGGGGGVAMVLFVRAGVFMASLVGAQVPIAPPGGGR